MPSGQSSACVLVGPGRAGTSVAIALVRAGWRVAAVAGRSPSSVDAAAQRFGARVATIADVADGAALVLIAVPDAALDETALTLASSAALPAGALVVHLAGARGLDVFAPLVRIRPDVRIGALHPLQTLPDADTGAARLPGSWCAVAGDPEVADLAVAIGCSPFVIADGQRPLYHAAACVAANHLVALLGQVERLASAAGVPLDAFLPLVRTSVDNVAALGAHAALTGPVARGDVDTVQRHLDALPADEIALYRALADAAARVAGREPLVEKR